jgi:hypothetical protein
VDESHRLIEGIQVPTCTYSMIPFHEVQKQTKEIYVDLKSEKWLFAGGVNWVFCILT